VKRLFWDIETSPNIGLFWAAGWKRTIPVENIIQERAIICICYKWEGEKRVRSLEWDEGDDRQLLEDFAPIIEEADEMIAHNGDYFDMRWYNGRHLIHGLPPLPIAKTVDTLKIAKRRFYLNSNKLDYLAKFMLGDCKVETSYGLWKEILLENDPLAMAKMVRYCRKDVLLIEQVWERLRSYETPGTHAAVEKSGNHKDRWMCAHCGSPNVKTSKTRATAAGMIRHQMQCHACSRYYSIANAVHEWYLEAKRFEREVLDA